MSTRTGVWIEKFSFLFNIMIVQTILISILVSLVVVNCDEISATSTGCPKPFQLYSKCMVPQIHRGNCSVTGAISKLVSVLRNSNGSFHPPPYTTVSNQITKAGYTSTEHKITTQNGYILSAFRIIKHGLTPSGCSKQPLILQHGASTNCGSWTLASTHDAVVWMLVESGFDVWLTCNRGTMYSAKHKLDKKMGFRYWDFDMTDLALDSGLWVDYILQNTNCSNIVYVGHSMGTITMFSLLSFQPEYNEKISHFFAISATPFMSHATSIITPIASLECNHLLFGNLLVPRGYSLNVPFPGRWGRKMYHTYVPYMCGATDIEGFFCSAVAATVFGCGYDNTNYTMLAKAIPFFLDNLSFKAYRHLAQNMVLKQFCQFDYGPKKNIQKYGQCTPPCFDLINVRTNVTVIQMSNDGLVGHEDVDKLMKSLVSVRNKELVNVPGVRNHLDVLVGNNPQFYVNVMKERLGLATYKSGR